MKGLFLLFLSVYVPCITYAQELPRRSFLGIQMEPVTADVARIMELKDTSGALINKVIPGSTAEASGFRPGDVLLRINDRNINTPQEAVSYVGSNKNSTTFSFILIRDKKTICGKGIFKPYPVESYSGLKVKYTQVKTSSGLQRIIITSPENKTGLPAVIFIGGIGCYSLDMPFDTARAEVQLLNTLARAGFTTIRIEKSGIGDNAGYSKPCNEIGFKEEAEGYITSVSELKRRNEIGDRKLYIIGHSMGGVMAPLVAQQAKVDGIIAYGTIGSNFIEYLLKTRRTIGEAYDWPPEETDEYIKNSCECAAYYFIEKNTTEQAAHKNPVCSEYLSVFDLRSRSYNDELYALNIPGIWKSYTGKALLAWGRSDYISSEEDHRIIAGTVNRYHNGNASFVVIPNADHGMNYAASFNEARTNPGAYNPEVGNVILKWLKQQS